MGVWFKDNANLLMLQLFQIFQYKLMPVAIPVYPTLASEWAESFAALIHNFPGSHDLFLPEYLPEY